MLQEKLITNRELLNNLINIIKFKDVEPISIINVKPIETGYRVDYLNGDLESKDDIITHDKLSIVKVKEVKEIY